MHLVDSHEGQAAKKAAAERAPFGPGFAEDVASRTEKLEVWGSSFKDPGPDFTEFRAFDKAGEPLAKRRIDGC